MATSSKPTPNKNQQGPSRPETRPTPDMDQEVHGKGDNHGGDHHHMVTLPEYLKVFAALIFLTVVTVLASLVDFGPFNAVIAFGIASVKAGLVLAIFMHLKYDNMMNRVIILSSAFFLFVLYFFCIIDETTRIVIAP
jgi:cytochrome c oxidase subunit 4